MRQRFGETFRYRLRHDLSVFFMLLFLLPVLFSPLTARAEPVFSERTEKASIEDLASLLNSAQQSSLLEQAAELAKTTGLEIRLVTTDNTGGKETSVYAEDYFESLSDSFSGGCYIVDMDNREFYIATYGDLIPVLTDDRIERIVDHVQDYAYSGSWEKLFSGMLSDTSSYWARGVLEGTTLYDTDTGTYTVYEKTKTITPFMLLTSFFAALIGFCAVFLPVQAGYSNKGAGRNDYPFHENVQLHLKEHSDVFVTRHVAQRRLPHNDPPAGGGGGGGGPVSTVHHTSSGHVAGGGGGHF